MTALDVVRKDVAIRRWSASPTARRGAVVVALLIALESVVLAPYFTGESVPPWDFLGGYNTDAHYWWASGGILDAPQWIPSVWAGYPAAVNLQNSSWYLPVGLIELFGTYDLHAAAALAALHIGFGALGAYLLAGSLQVGFVGRLVVTVATFFSPVFFANAQHVDIVRGAAWVPWVLLVCSTAWPWRRWWGWLLAPFVLWQAITAAYPGILLAAAYVIPGWLAVQAWRAPKAERVRFLLLVVSSGVVAVLLCAPRLLPYALFRDETGNVLPELTEADPWAVGSLLFGVDVPGLANDVSMRSYFVTAVVIFLLAFVTVRHRAVLPGMTLVVPAAALGLSILPWYDGAQLLPGLGLSRHTANDFKAFLLLGLAVLAGVGVERLRKHLERPDRSSIVRWAVAAGTTVAFLMVGILGPYTVRDWAPSIALLAGLLGVTGVVLIARWRSESTSRLPRPWWSAIASLLVLSTVASGAAWAQSISRTWSTDRVDSEIVTFGATVDDLLADGTSAEDVAPGDGRPARIPLTEGYQEADLFLSAWNRVLYTGGYSVGGYLNLKGSLTQEQMIAALLDPASGTSVAAFLAAPGMIAGGESGEAPTATQLGACAMDGACGSVAAVSTGYDDDAFSYDVVVDDVSIVTLNEAYYQGWFARACDADRCEELVATRSDQGLLSLDLTPGTYELRLEYRTPGRDASLIAFAIGAFIAVAALGVRALHRRRDMKR